MKHFVSCAVALFVLCGAMFSAQSSSAAAYDNAPYGSIPYSYAPYGNAPYGYTPYGNAPYGVPYNSMPYVNQPNYYGTPMNYYPAIGKQANPSVGNHVQDTHMTPTQIRTGYTRGEIRAMPLTERPNRPGHFIGNTIRRRTGSY